MDIGIKKLLILKTILEVNMIKLNYKYTNIRGRNLTCIINYEIYFK